MKFNRFLIWCAGSDANLLQECPKSEQIKHQGYGMLVLIPAILALISMSFALSTLEALHGKPYYYLAGGLLWALIIFAFDRFIVSTHKRKTSNKAEVKNPTFFLRLTFAVLLGIVISHPLVMMYFDGSIEDQTRADIKSQKAIIADTYDQQLKALDQQYAQYDSLYMKKLAERDRQAALVAMEIDGEIIANVNGAQQTTGIRGYGPSAENKVAHLARLQKELEEQKAEYQIQKVEIEKSKKSLLAEKEESVNRYSETADYLRKELALQKLKDQHPLVGVTQWFLITLFVLIDILPLIFKTFAPYGLYDKLLGEDASFLADTNTESRRIYLQQLYDQLNKA